VPVERIVGSVGRYGEFDRAFLPARGSAATRWKRIDRASHRGEKLPPVSLSKRGDSYFVEDGNYRVSVTHDQGREMIDAEVVELHVRIPAALSENIGAERSILLVVERATKKEERRRSWIVLPDATPWRRDGQKSGAPSPG
jgi:hypothetical protein